MPPEAATLKAVVPPIHSVMFVGWEVIEGSATTVTAVAALDTEVQPLPAALTTA